MKEIPGNCKLVAHNTGDGWYLCVQTQEGEEVAQLAWPDNWPDIMFTSDLREKGFEIQ